LSEFLRAHWGWVVALAACYWLLIFVLTHVPAGHFPQKALGVDKLAHFTAYLGLTFLVALCVRLRYGISVQTVCWILALVLAYGALDEITQAMVPGRSTDASDWLADALGAAAGLLSLELVIRTRPACARLVRRSA
jgi:VanZ family protein